MATAGVLEYLISINSSQLNSGLSKAENKVKDSGKKMSAKTVAIGNMVSKVAEKAVAATGKFVKGAIQDSMGFDKSMAQVAATLGKTTDEVQDLSKFARKMGATTAFTAQEAAQGLNYMALAGYDAQKSMKMLPQVLNLAAAGNMDLARASDMVTDAESALGLSTDEVSTMIDQMAKASSKTNTSVEQLGDAILTVGGTAKMMSGSTEELTAVLGVLADNGIKGSEGGTALRNVLLSLSAPTDKASKQIKKLGVDVFDAQGNMRDLPSIMMDMNDVMKDMTQEERTSIISDIFNKRDLKAVEALLGTNVTKWDALYKAIGNSNGAAKEMADTQLDNLAGDVTKFNSALGEAKLTIVEKLTPSFRNLTKAATNFVTKFANAWKRGGIKGALKEAWTMTKNVGHELASAFKKNIGLSGDATWTEVAQKIREKLSIKLNNVRLKLANYFELGDDASWAEIGSNVIKKLGENLKNKGEFLKALFLGDKYKEGESTWTQVAESLSEEVSKAFEKGGIIDLILGQAGDITGAAITFASDFITGAANWLSNSENVDPFISNIITAIQTAAPKIGEALGKVLGNADLWKSIGKGLTNASYALVEAIFGKDAAIAVRKFFGVALPNELSKSNTDILKQGWGKVYANILGGAGGIDNPANIEAARSEWDKYIKKVVDNSYFDKDVEEQFKGMFSFDNMLKYMTMGDKGLGDHIYEMIDTLSTALNEGDGVKIKAALNPDESKLKNLGPYYASMILNTVVNGGSGAGTGSNSNSGGIGGGGGGMVDAMSEFYRPAMNAKGNWNVPYDNYPSLLHRGEMVLTKSQARQFRDGGGGGFDVNSAINNAVSAAMSKVYVMMNGDKVGDLTTKRVRKNVNATSYNKLRAMGG